MTDIAPARPAATILLLRDRPELEVLMVRRHHQIDFATGALVFPGGKAEPGDQDRAWADRCLGYAEVAEPERSLRISALREAFEESGVLLARDAKGGAWDVDPRAAAARQTVAKGERPFLDLVRELDLMLDLAAMTLFARWITPAMMPKRFDTYFFLATAPSDQLAKCDGWETVDAEWIAPAEALRLGEAGQRKIIFPTRLNLELLARSGRTAEEAIAAARRRDVVVVEPKVVARPDGPTLTIPPDAGYGAVEELLSAAM